MKWPNAVLFHSRDHLQRLMEDYAVLDGVERAVRITDPAKLQKPKRAMWPWNQKIQDFEPHPLFDAITTCQRGPAEWEAFKQLVDRYIPHHKTELRSWMATNEPLIQVQWLQVADHHRMPVGSGSVEGKIREFLGTWLKTRAGRYQNARRLNKILGLMMLRLRGEARRGRFVTILRDHFHTNHQLSGVRDWHAWEDRGGRSSLAKLVHDANLRQRAEQRKDEIRRGAILRLRRWQDEDMRRKVLGLSPLRAGHRWTTGRKVKHRGVRGKFLSDFPDLMREWDYTLNWGTDPSKVRGTQDTRVFWRCRHDPDHVWDTRVTDRATHIRGCPYCMGQRVHPKDSLAAHSPPLAEEWHPTKNGTLTSDQVTAGSGRKVWWKDQKGHVWQAPVFSRAKNLANCQRCFVASQTKRPKKARSRTSG